MRISLLTGRSVVSMAVVLTLGLVLNVPAAALGGIAVDQDLLLAALLGVIVLPLVHRLVLR